MKVLLADSPHWKDLGEDFQQKYIDRVQAAHQDAAKLLPFGYEHISFLVQPRKQRLIKITHDNGCTYNSSLIELAFDNEYAAEHPEQIIKQARAMVFHEMNHAARFHLGIWHWRESFLDYCVLEGLATVFAREYAGYDAPWGQYSENDVKAWLKEVKKAGKDIKDEEYMYTHPDGRKWIGYKVGTYIVDQAMKNSGKSVIELTRLEFEDIMKLAEI